MRAKAARSCASSSSERRVATSADIEPSSALRTVASSSSTPSDESFSSRAESTTGSRMFHEVDGCACVPRPCTTVTRPFSSMRLTDSRMTVRLTPKWALSASSGGRDSPGATSPVTIALTRSCTTATPSRAAGMRASAAPRNERPPPSLGSWLMSPVYRAGGGGPREHAARSIDRHPWAIGDQLQTGAVRADVWTLRQRPRCRSAGRARSRPRRP